MEFNIRMSRRHNLHLDYFKLNRFSQQPLPRDIQFGDFNFSRRNDVSARSSTGAY